MLLLKAEHLIAQALIHIAQWILRWGIRAAVVDCVNGKEKVVAADILVKPRSAEVLMNALFWMTESLGNSTAKVRSIGNRPEREQRLHGGVYADVLFHARSVRQVALARLIVWNQGHGTQSPILPKTFVVAEDKNLIVTDRAA